MQYLVMQKVYVTAEFFEICVLDKIIVIFPRRPNMFYLSL